MPMALPWSSSGEISLPRMNLGLVRCLASSRGTEENGGGGWGNMGEKA